ncbi:hypothetical protein DJ68_11730 [Halorubrum sp. C3]|nr:hypothetical protein DJ68_11730 [Halorubrum sp. C3]
MLLTNRPTRYGRRLLSLSKPRLDRLLKALLMTENGDGLFVTRMQPLTLVFWNRTSQIKRLMIKLTNR